VLGGSGAVGVAAFGGGLTCPHSEQQRVPSGFGGVPTSWYPQFRQQPVRAQRWTLRRWRHWRMYSATGSENTTIGNQLGNRMAQKWVSAAPFGCSGSLYQEIWNPQWLKKARRRSGGYLRSAGCIASLVQWSSGVARVAFLSGARSTYWLTTSSVPLPHESKPSELYVSENGADLTTRRPIWSIALWFRTESRAKARMINRLSAALYAKRRRQNIRGAKTAKGKIKNQIKCQPIWMRKLQIILAAIIFIIPRSISDAVSYFKEGAKWEQGHRAKKHKYREPNIFEREIL
jgi:hypothetical protein